MSGPKVSVYDLTPAHRARIAAELQRRLRELERRQELLKELHSVPPRIEQMKVSLSSYAFVAQEETIHLETTTLNKHLEEAYNAAQHLTGLVSTAADQQDNTSLEKSLAIIRGKEKQLEQTIRSISDLAAKTADSLQSVLSESISNLFASVDKTVVETKEDSVHNEQFSLLLSQANHQYLPENLRQQIACLAERKASIPIDSIDSFFAVEVQPILKRCEDFVSLWEKFGVQYEQLLERYEILAKENGRIDVSLVPFSTTAIDELSKLVAIEEIEYQRQAEEKHIENSITSVMTEMGYCVKGQREVSRRNGTHYNSSLFQYDHESAVNVIFSDDGKITMEVGKTDNCDRIPDGRESREIVEKMESFCGDFAEIEKRLAEKGVVLKNRIRLSPPTPEYAQIINVSDYIAPPVKEDKKRKRNVVKKPQQLSIQD